MMRIVLLGAPGSGKGTQAQRLQAKYGAPQVSSGDLLRDAVARGTELGRRAKEVMEAGRLVSDDIVLGLIRDRLSRPDAAKGFILDGFPRNIEQANALDALLRDIGQPLEAVLMLDVRNETLLRRLAGRRICRQCGTVYNVHSLPAGATTCAREGGELYQRPDDQEDVIARRLEVYEEQTRPLVQHYSNLGLLRVVAGEGELDEVFERMESAALVKPPPASKIRVAKTGSRKQPAKAGAKRAAKPAAKKASRRATRSAAKPSKPKKTKKTKKTVRRVAAVRAGAAKGRSKRAVRSTRKTAATRTRASARRRVAPARRKPSRAK